MTFFLLIFFFFLRQLFRAALGLQQNWGEGTFFLHTQSSHLYIYSLPYYHNTIHFLWNTTFMKDAPTLTHHNCPKSTISLRVHTSSTYGCGRSIMAHIHYCTDCFHFSKSPLCSAYLSFLPHQPLATTHLYIVSIALPFWALRLLYQYVYLLFPCLIALTRTYCLSKDFQYNFEKEWYDRPSLFFTWSLWENFEFLTAK